MPVVLTVVGINHEGSYFNLVLLMALYYITKTGSGSCENSRYNCIEDALQKQIFHFDKKNLSYTINRFNFFKLNDKIY